MHIKRTYLRDRALFLTMYEAALTTSEASTLQLGDMRRDPRDRANLILTVNPTGELPHQKAGERVWIAPRRSREVRVIAALEPERNAVRALTQWLEVAGIRDRARTSGH